MNTNTNTGDDMNDATDLTAAAAILTAAAAPSRAIDIIRTGTRTGSIGMTRIGAAKLVERLIRSGRLAVTFDSRNRRLVVAA